MGALTSKPYAFRARPWELESVYAFDFFDPLGSSIRVDVRGSSLMRILPRISSQINGEWISDRIRFVLYALKRQRILYPTLFRKSLDYFYTGWTGYLDSLAFDLLHYFQRSYDTPFRLLLGPLLDYQSALFLKNFISCLTGFSHANFFSSTSTKPHPDWRSDFYFQNPFSNLVDAILVFCSNLSAASPIFFSKLRQVVRDGARYYTFATFDKTVFSSSVNLGFGHRTFERLFHGNHIFCRFFTTYSAPTTVLGDCLETTSSTFGSIQALFGRRNSNSRSFFLPSTVFSLTELELGLGNFIGSFNAPVPLLFSFGFTDFEMVPHSIGYGEVYPLTKFHHFFGFQGEGNLEWNFTSHGPTPAPLEKEFFQVNLQGQLLYSMFALKGPNYARSEWRIITVLADVFSSLLYSEPWDYYHFQESWFNFIRETNLADTPNFEISHFYKSQQFFHFSFKPLPDISPFYLLVDLPFKTENLPQFTTTLDRLSPLFALYKSATQLEGNFFSN